MSKSDSYKPSGTTGSALSVAGSSNELIEPDPAINKAFRCGLGPCWMKKLQFLATMPFFSVFLSAFAFMYGVQIVYLFSVLSNVEKAFGFTSNESGIIVTMIEIGYFLTILILGHFGRRLNRPLVIGLGAICVGIAGFIMTLPHFLLYDGFVQGSNVTDQATDLLLCSKNDSICVTQEGNTNEDGYTAKIIFICALILTGIGTTPVLVIGLTFVDDNAPKGKSAMYVCFVFAARALAPVAGYLLGSVTVEYHVSLKDSSETGLEVSDRNFIGAWWVGYLVTAPLNILISIPLLFFPKQLRIYDEDLKAAKSMDNVKPQEKQTFVKEIKGLLKCLLRIITNAPFMLFIASFCFQIGPTYGYFIFIGKYLEKQFNITPSNANVIVAIVLALAPAIALFISGIVTSQLILKYNMKIWRLCLYSTIVVVILVLAFVALFFIKCDTAEIVGVDVISKKLDLSQPCNMNCHCSSSNFEPLCGDDGKAYFSACYAGCTNSTDRKYSNCTCLENNSTTGVLGTCAESCDMVYVFAVFSFILTFIEPLTSGPWTLFSFRIVEPKDKSMAMAILNLLVTCMVFVIPPIYGLVIDKTCAIEREGESCGADKSVCLIYDQDKYRINLHALTFGLRLVYPLSLILCLVTSRNKVLYGDEDDEKDQEKDQKTQPKSDGVDHPYAFSQDVDKEDGQKDNVSKVDSETTKL